MAPLAASISFRIRAAAMTLSLSTKRVSPRTLPRRSQAGAAGSSWAPAGTDQSPATSRTRAAPSESCFIMKPFLKLEKVDVDAMVQDPILEPDIPIQASLRPAFFRMVASRHQLVKPLWNRFAPTKAVNHSHLGLT